MRKGSIMSVSSPRLVSMATGEKVELEELGGWRLHADTTGLIDRFVDTDEDALAEIRAFLGYMPSQHAASRARSLTSRFRKLKLSEPDRTAMRRRA